MALFRKLFFKKPPDGLLEISERVYVFDSCFTTDVLEEEDYKVYMGNIVTQLRDQFPDASFLVFNFREGERRSLVTDILSLYDMTVMDYPRQYEGCPLLPLEMIHHFLRSGESWLTLEGQHNVVLMHCERGGWAVLAFILAALLIYRKQNTGEQRTLEMIHKEAPKELLQLLSPLNPIPSQIRYLQYISRRSIGSEWPPPDRALTLDCLILRIIPNFDGEGGCRPIVRIFGQDPFVADDRTPQMLFSMAKKNKNVRYSKQADCDVVKIDIQCNIQGDVVLECINVDADLEREEMMFRVMFNTAFIRSNILMLNRDDIDILWNAKDRFPKEFRAEVLFSDMDASSSPLLNVATLGGEEKGGLPMEAFAKVQEIFNNVDWVDGKGDAALRILQKISESNALQGKLDTVVPADANNWPFLPAKAGLSPVSAWIEDGKDPKKFQASGLLPCQPKSPSPLTPTPVLSTTNAYASPPPQTILAPEFDMSELECLFSTALPASAPGGSGERAGGRRASIGSKLERVHLVDLRRANNCEIMLTKVKMPLPDVMSAVLALDDSILDADQVDNLIKFCPTKEEMELLKGYTGDKDNLGRCEQFFLEMMKVPRVESKLRVFSFKIQFASQVSDLRKSLSIVNDASREVRESIKLRKIMQTILSLGNALNQGTARGSAIGFRLDSLLKLIDTRARNNKMTLMHYLLVSTLVNFVTMFRRAHTENCKQAEFERKKAEKEAEREKLKVSPLKRESEQPLMSPIRSKIGLNAE